MVDFEWFIKYFSGAATPEEAMRVADFARESPEQYAYFLGLFQSWQEAGGNEYQKPDIKKEWMDFRKKHLLKAIKRRRARNLSIATSIAILLGLSGFFIFIFPNRNPKIIALTTQTSKTIVLNDSTIITLAPKAQFSYPEKFEQNIREVNLRSGNAEFKVSHHSNWPFIIHLSQQLNIKVTGTIFSVTQDKESVSVNLKQGKVQFYSPTDTLALSSGQVGKYIITQNHFLLVAKTGNFNFSDLSLKEAAQQLNNYFGVRIHFQNLKIAEYKLTAGFKNKNLKQIIRVIAATFNLKYEINGTNVYLDEQ